MAMAVAYSPNAMALDRGTCLPFNQMVTALQAEGQFDVINVDYSVPFQKMAMYTTNKNLSRGYEITGVRPDQSSNPTQLCIDNVLYEIRFRNAWEGTLPSSYFQKNPNSPSQFGDLQSTLENASRRNEFPTLQGRILGAGNETLTVVAGTQYRTGAQFVTLTNGTALNLANYRNFAYTPEGARILRGQAQAKTHIPGHPTDKDLGQAIATAYVGAGIYTATSEPNVIRRLRNNGQPLSDTEIVVSEEACTPAGAETFSCRFIYRFSESFIPIDPKGFSLFDPELSEETSWIRVRKTGTNEIGSGTFRLVSGKWTSPEFLQLARDEAVQERQKRLARQRTLEQRAANRRAAVQAEQQAVQARAAAVARQSAAFRSPAGVPAPSASDVENVIVRAHISTGRAHVNRDGFLATGLFSQPLDIAVRSSTCTKVQRNVYDCRGNFDYQVRQRRNYTFHYQFSFDGQRWNSPGVVRWLSPSAGSSQRAADDARDREREERYNRCMDQMTSYDLNTAGAMAIGGGCQRY